MVYQNWGREGERELDNLYFLPTGIQLWGKGQIGRQSISCSGTLPSWMSTWNFERRSTHLM